MQCDKSNTKIYRIERWDYISLRDNKWVREELESLVLSSHYMISISTAPHVINTQAQRSYAICPNWVPLWTRFKSSQTQT